jgi:hypothetical protein
MIFKKGDLYQYSSSDINSSLMNFINNHENAVGSYTNDDYYSDFDTDRPKVKKDFVKSTKKKALVVSPKIKEILHKEALSKSLCSFIEKDKKHEENNEEESIASQSDDSSQEINAPVDYISNSTQTNDQTTLRNYPSSPKNLMQSFGHYSSSPLDVIRYPPSPPGHIPAMIRPVDVIQSYPSSNLMNNELYQSPMYMQDYYQPDYIFSNHQRINGMNNVYPMESTFNTQNLFGDVKGAVTPVIPHTYSNEYFFIN